MFYTGTNSTIQNIDDCKAFIANINKHAGRELVFVNFADGFRMIGDELYMPVYVYSDVEKDVMYSATRVVEVPEHITSSFYADIVKAIVDCLLNVMLTKISKDGINETWFDMSDEEKQEAV